MKTREKILEYVRKQPMATAEQITGELGINYESVIASLSTLERKGKVKATDSLLARYVVLPKKSIKGDDGQGFMDYVDGLSRENRELKAEINRLRAELNECRRKLARLAQRILRENI